MPENIKFRSKEQLAQWLLHLPTDAEHVYQPEIGDLFSLYSTVRRHAIIAIQEFGSGWSTAVLALALHENFLSFGEEYLSKVRHPNPFKLMTIDASDKFQKIALMRLPSELADRVLPVVSQVQMSTFNGQACHLFCNLPPHTSDLIYLDGPDCDQVHGDVNGFHVRFGGTEYKYGLPMSADILVQEAFLWSGTRIITDGRGANAHFLRYNLKRNWEYRHDLAGDQHHFRLLDEPWGSIAMRHLEFCESHKLPII